MFVYELMIKRKDEGKETAEEEEEKQVFTLFTGFLGFFVVILCANMENLFLFLYLDFFSRVWVFLSLLSIKSQLYLRCGM